MAEHMNGFITPKLDYIECPTANEIFTDERLRRLLPGVLYFSVGLDAEAIANCLINAGCVQVTADSDKVVFRGWRLPLQAAWAKCLDITGNTRELSFEVVEAP